MVVCRSFGPGTDRSRPEYLARVVRVLPCHTLTQRKTPHHVPHLLYEPTSGSLGILRESTLQGNQRSRQQTVESHVCSWSTMGLRVPDHDANPPLFRQGVPPRAGKLTLSAHLCRSTSS